MKTLKTCLVILCLLYVRAVGMPQFSGATFFMKEIILDRGKTGKVALVDDDDFEWLNQFKWRSKQARRSVVFYAVRTLLNHESSKKAGISMHRQILKINNPNICVDHKDRNGLNNQKSNLRICNRSQNNANRESRKGLTSNYMGVCYDISRKIWVASISTGNKARNIGRFKTEKEAALAYNKKASEIHGEFANLNDI